VKKRIMLFFTVASVTAALMVAVAMPALAVTPYDCRDTLYALYRGEELTEQDRQLISQHPSFGACVQANILAGAG
jgi:hypothetical protein